MANVDRHAPGTFCWYELGTTDQQAAKSFYSALLGWSAFDAPMGPDEVYTMFSLGGRGTGGGYKLRPDMIAQGIPPHWIAYVAVENADATAAKVEPAGGKVIAGPFDVMTFGRMAVIEDPTGAVLSIWQPLMHQGVAVKDEAGTFCWADLMTPDPEKAAKFYNAVFGWLSDPGKNNSGYLHLRAGDQHIGGIPPAGSAKGAPPHWMLYMQVDNCDASTAKATELGAKVCMAPMTMEGVGRWSAIFDPQGAAFALFQSLPR